MRDRVGTAAADQDAEEGLSHATSPPPRRAAAAAAAAAALMGASPPFAHPRHSGSGGGASVSASASPSAHRRQPLLNAWDATRRRRASSAASVSSTAAAEAEADEVGSHRFARYNWVVEAYRACDRRDATWEPTRLLPFASNAPAWGMLVLLDALLCIALFVCIVYNEVLLAEARLAYSGFVIAYYAWPLVVMR